MACTPTAKGFTAMDCKRICGSYDASMPARQRSLYPLRTALLNEHAHVARFWPFLPAFRAPLPVCRAHFAKC